MVGGTLIQAGEIAVDEEVDSAMRESMPTPMWFPEPVVQKENTRLRGNGRYRVGDRFFKSWRGVDQYIAEGLATWRDGAFDTWEAASGELFANEALTAAHRYLPIPSYVRVTNLSNGEQTVVRVTDRGPFRSDRLIDLSKAAALRLGFGGAESRPVRIELITTNGPRYVLETNYVYGKDAVMAIMSRLAEIELGHLSTQVMPHQYENRFRVRIGDFGSLADANYLANWLLANLQLKSSLLKE